MVQQSVVIYRSEFERQADLFWLNNPEYIVWFILFVVGVVLFVVGWNKIEPKVKRFINKNKYNRRW